MAYFLAKSEPSVYSIDQLRQDRKTTWDGVTNPQAVKTIASMKRGDRVLIYHSGGESAIVGAARVESDPRPCPKNPKSWVVDLRFLRRLTPPVPLTEIKASHLFDDWALVRQSRLSTMSVPPEFITWLAGRYRWLGK